VSGFGILKSTIEIRVKIIG